MQITSQEVLNPTPDHVDVSLTSRFITDSGYHPDLKAFNASLYLKGRDQPFINLGIPDIDGAKNGTVVQVDEEAAVIRNRDEFERYCQTTLGSAEYTVFLTGSGGLKQGGLPNTNVDYNNSVTIKGKPSETSMDNCILTNPRPQPTQRPYCHKLLSSLKHTRIWGQFARPSHDPKSISANACIGRRVC